jgi:hypothetical protein
MPEQGARIGRSGGHTVERTTMAAGVTRRRTAASMRSAYHSSAVISIRLRPTRAYLPPRQAPSHNSTAQARTAPVGPPRGPFACVTPKGHVHGRCQKAHLRAELGWPNRLRRQSPQQERSNGKERASSQHACRRWTACLGRAVKNSNG